MMGAAGVRDADVTYTNVIQCRPPNNDFPTDAKSRYYISLNDAYKAIEHCRKAHLQPVLEARPWKRIDLLGDKPLEFVAQRYEGITKWRGSPMKIPGLGDKLIAIPTYHPAFVMRSQVWYPLVANDLMKSLDPPAENYNLMPSLDQVRAFKATAFAFDIETPQWKSLGEAAPIEMVGLCANATEVIVVPFRGAYIDELRRIFASAKNVVGHNCVQFDLPRLARDGVVIDESRCQIWDTQLMHHLCFPNFSGADAGHDLEFLGSQFTSKPAWKHDKLSYELYCARDVDVTWQAFEDLRVILKQYNLERLHHLVSVPLGKICRLMRDTGVNIDPEHLKVVRERFLQEIAVEEKLLPEPLRTREVAVRKNQKAPEGYVNPKTGKPAKIIKVEATEQIVPWRSPKWKKDFLYGKDEPWQLGQPVQLSEKGKVSTGKVVLERLYNRTKNPAILALRKLNRLSGLLNTFAKEKFSKGQVIHTNFNVHGTKFGRLSSSDPVNLQNIPEAARYIYVPSQPGWKWIDIDYSQIENRLSAHLAGDKARLSRLADENFSEHKFAASLFFDIAYEDVVKDSDRDAPYKRAKAIVHGTDGGMGSKKIALLEDRDLKEVKRLQDLWKKQIEETIRWQERQAKIAEQQKYLYNAFGRRCDFYTSSTYTESIRFNPQSLAADIIFRAMIGLMYERIGWPESKVREVVPVYEPLPRPANLLIQVHDSLNIEAPQELVPEVIRVVKRVMQQPWKELNGLSIPIGISIGDSWGEVKTYKEPLVAAA